jgi:hypothetical protein
MPRRRSTPGRGDPGSVEHDRQVVYVPRWQRVPARRRGTAHVWQPGHWFAIHGWPAQHRPLEMMRAPCASPAGHTEPSAPRTSQQHRGHPPGLWPSGASSPSLSGLNQGRKSHFANPYHPVCWPAGCSPVQPTRLPDAWPAGRAQPEMVSAPPRVGDVDDPDDDPDQDHDIARARVPGEHRPGRADPDAHRPQGQHDRRP